MKNIRQKVFETNSSSTHSVSIYNATKGIYDTIAPNELGQLVLTGGTFGWEWQQYNDALTKANYAAIFADGDQKMTDMLMEVLKDHTGAKEVVRNFSTNSEDDSYSYIDHQSDLGEGGDALKAFDTPNTLKNFIFHPESYLFTGNDNENEPPNFYDVEFGIEYTHQLEIEGTDLTEKFQSEPDEDTLKEAIGRLMGKHPMYTQDYSYPVSQRSTSYEYYPWEHNTTNGIKFSSFDKLKDGVLILFQIKNIYSKGKANKYLGDEIKSRKEIKFNLKKL